MKVTIIDLFDGEETIAEMKFVCDNVFGPGERNGVRYRAETVTDAGVRGGLIVSSSRRDLDKSIVDGRTQIIKSVGRSKADMKYRTGGQLGVLRWKWNHRKDKINI